MRVLDRNASSVPKGEDHILIEVDKLLEKILCKKILGLAEFQRISLPHDGTVKITDNRVTCLDLQLAAMILKTVPLVREELRRWIRFSSVWNFEPGTEIIKNPSGAFEIAMWDRVPPPPDQLLLECGEARRSRGIMRSSNWRIGRWNNMVLPVIEGTEEYGLRLRQMSQFQHESEKSQKVLSRCLLLRKFDQTSGQNLFKGRINQSKTV